MTKSLIIGHTGQDGTYLWNLLSAKNYELMGVSNHQVISSTQGNSETIDIRNYHYVERLLKDFQPDELYYLAAVHQSSSDNQMDDGELFQKSLDINSKAFINFLEAVRLQSKKTKIFYAASSHIFGETSTTKMQDRVHP